MCVHSELRQTLFFVIVDCWAFSIENLERARVHTYIHIYTYTYVYIDIQEKHVTLMNNKAIAISICVYIDIYIENVITAIVQRRQRSFCISIPFKIPYKAQHEQQCRTEYHRWGSSMYEWLVAPFEVIFMPLLALNN